VVNNSTGTSLLVLIVITQIYLHRRSRPNFDSYRVCHGYVTIVYESILAIFELSVRFLGSCFRSENWLEPKIGKQISITSKFSMRKSVKITVEKFSKTDTDCISNLDTTLVEGKKAIFL